MDSPFCQIQLAYMYVLHSSPQLLIDPPGIGQEYNRKTFWSNHGIGCVKGLKAEKAAQTVREMYSM